MEYRQKRLICLHFMRVFHQIKKYFSQASNIFERPIQRYLTLWKTQIEKTISPLYIYIRRGGILKYSLSDFLLYISLLCRRCN